jgi:hypothetical protein
LEDIRNKLTWPNEIAAVTFCAEYIRAVYDGKKALYSELAIDSG